VNVPVRLDDIEVPDVIRAPRTDRIYNCHAYLTKVPVAAILPFLEQFTRPDEVVLDPFAGSGMTGLAAAMQGRRALLADISVLGRHIARGYLSEVGPSALRDAAERAVSRARDALGELYVTRRASDGAAVEMKRTVWSFTYVCPACSKPMVYYRHLRKNGTAQPDACPGCGEAFVRRAWPKAEDAPVEVVVPGEDGKLVGQEVQDLDLLAIDEARRDPRQGQVPSQRIDDHREMFRRCALGKHGLTETKLFFSSRNALALFELWSAVNAVEDDRLRTKLRFAFTAILPRASRRYQWGPKRPLNAQNQTYYIAPVYYEWNVFDLFLRKVEAAIRADGELHRAMPLFAHDVAGNVQYEIASADALTHVEDEAVDYVFTDPPFGSNIFYSDMNLFHEAWLGSTTQHEREAVMHTTGRQKNGAAERYEALLRGAFDETFRVLKPARHMSVVFGNSNGAIWALVQRALRDAGFDTVPIHVAILDKGQRSVKGLNSGSEGVVTVDLVLTVRKPGIGEEIDRVAPALANAEDLLDAAVGSLDADRARNPSYVYAATVREAIQRRQRVDNLHLGDVLIALRKAGYTIDPKTGLLNRPASAGRLRAASSGAEAPAG
jgi:16S rRNA G966 N2-methylase RsmD